MPHGESCSRAHTHTPIHTRTHTHTHTHTPHTQYTTTSILYSCLEESLLLSSGAGERYGLDVTSSFLYLKLPACLSSSDNFARLWRLWIVRAAHAPLASLLTPSPRLTRNGRGGGSSKPRGVKKQEKKKKRYRQSCFRASAAVRQHQYPQGPRALVPLVPSRPSSNLLSSVRATELHHIHPTCPTFASILSFPRSSSSHLITNRT
ncbi:hypothetical protein LY76DRAFT_398018 [Colletotrichum caudatum]|nr:hypothetical protein LY76DRAFT_398018 [Colletotrichum caudatum]